MDSIPAIHAASVVGTTLREHVLHGMHAAKGATGEFTPQAYGTTPATTQCAVTPCGDIGFLLADLPTDFDVVFTPEKGDVVELNGREWLVVKIKPKGKKAKVSVEGRKVTSVPVA